MIINLLGILIHFGQLLQYSIYITSIILMNLLFDYNKLLSIIILPKI